MAVVPPAPWPTFPVLSRALDRGPVLSERKVRLFAVACCRDLWETLPAGPVREAVDVAERYADGTADEGERHCALDQFLGIVGARRYPGNEIVGVRGEYYTPEQLVILALRLTAEHFYSRTGRLLAGGEVAQSWTVTVSARVWEESARVRSLRRRPHRAGVFGGLWQAIGRWTGGLAGQAERQPLDYVVAEVDADRFLSRLVTEVFRHHLVPVAFDPAWRTEAVVSLARGMYESRDFAPMPVLADALEEAGCTEPDLLVHCRGPGLHVRGCWVVDLVLGKS